MNKTFRLSEISKATGIGMWFIRRLAKAGKLPAKRILGGFLFVLERDLPLVKAAIEEAGFSSEGLDSLGASEKTAATTKGPRKAAQATK